MNWIEFCMNGSNKGDLKVFRYPDLFYDKRQENFTKPWIWKSYYYIILLLLLYLGKKSIIRKIRLSGLELVPWSPDYRASTVFGMFYAKYAI